MDFDLRRFESEIDEIQGLDFSPEDIFDKPIEIPEDRFVEDAMQRYEIETESLEIAMQVAIALTKMQDDEDEEQRQVHEYKVENKTNNAWNIFREWYHLKKGDDRDTRYYKRASSDPAWEKFLEANQELVQDIMDLIEIWELFHPLQTVLIQSQMIAIRAQILDYEPPIAKMIDQTHGENKAYYFIRSRIEALMILALDKMQKAGMDRPYQYADGRYGKA